MITQIILLDMAPTLTSGEVNFLFNQFSRRTLLLQSESIDASGKVTLNPTLKELR